MATPDDLRFLREIAKASLGEAADLDGDGVSEVTAARLEDGTTRWDFDTLNDDWPMMTAERLPSGKVTLAFRLNQTSQVNAVHVYDGPSSTFEWNDNLRANYFNRRETRLLDEVAATLTIRRETRATESDAWVPETAYTLPSTLEQPAPASCGFPPAPDVISTLPPAPSGAGITFSDVPGYQCSPEAKQKIQRAYVCALRKAMNGCLLRRNSKLAVELLGLFVAKRTTFLASCEVESCDGAALANTSSAYLPLQGGGRLGRIRFSPNKLNTGGCAGSEDGNWCKVMLHELLHHTSARMSPDHNSAALYDDLWNDQVESCAADCAANCYAGSACEGKAKPGELCAACAGTPSEREACGYTEEKRVTGSVCPNLDLCHAGLTGNALCTTCVDWAFVDCLQNPLPGSERLFHCCLECPAGYDKNDRPCNTTMEEFGPRGGPGCDKSPDCQ